jgi:hypothetical protein
MNKFQELDALLSSDEEDYYLNDSFLVAKELIDGLTEEDIHLLVSAWICRDDSWCDRFSQACAPIKQSVLLSLIEIAISSNNKISPTLGLMIRLPKQANQSVFYQGLLEYAEKLWHEKPQLQRQIQMCTWSCGLSGRLLKRLGFKSWKEAGL